MKVLRESQAVLYRIRDQGHKAYSATYCHSGGHPGSIYREMYYVFDGGDLGWWSPSLRVLILAVSGARHFEQKWGRRKARSGGNRVFMRCLLNWSVNGRLKTPSTSCQPITVSPTRSSNLGRGSLDTVKQRPPVYGLTDFKSWNRHE